MIRVSRILHGKKTLGDLIKQTGHSSRAPNGRYLAFSDLPRPVIFWNITGRCNLSCSHCYLEAGNRTWNELSTAECRALIDDLGSAGVPLLIITGGEPLVREDIWEILDYSRRAGMKIALSSNGTLIDDDIADDLRKTGVEYVGISLDGASPATHDRVRGIPGSFERSVKGLRSCVNAGVPSGIRMTVTRENQDQVIPLVDLALKLSVPRFCLYWLVPAGRGIEEYEAKQVSSTEARAIFERLYQHANVIDPATLEILTVDAPQDSIHLTSLIEQEDPQNREALNLLALQGCCCSAGERVANIDPEGNLYPCQFAQSPEFLLGNVRQVPFSRIWESRTGSPSLLNGESRNGCSACPSFPLCKGGCHIRARFSPKGKGPQDPLCFRVTPESR